MSDRRILTEASGEIIRYASIGVCHWMFRDLYARVVQAARSGGEAAVGRFKEQHHNRIELEPLSGEFIVLEGLGGAFQALFSFFNFVIWQRRKLSG